MYSRLNHCLQCKNSHFCHRSCNSSLSCHCTQQFTYRAFLPTAAELDLIAPPKPAAAAINIYDIFAHFRQFWLVPAISSWPVDAWSCSHSPVPCRRVHRVLHAPPPATHMPIDSLQLLDYRGYSCTRPFAPKGFQYEKWPMCGVKYLPLAPSLTECRHAVS